MLGHLEFMLVHFGSRWGHGASWWHHHGAKWTLGAPRCAQREVKVRQDGRKRGPKEPLGTPRRAPGDPQRGLREPKRALDDLKGTQWEPKVSPRGSKGGKVDAQEGQHMQTTIV